MYALSVVLDSSKIVRKVAKDLLKPFNAIRVSDRLWSYDGGWWLLHFSFDPSAWSKGAYSELALQPLYDWRTHVTLAGILAPRHYAELKDPVEFEVAFRDNLTKLLPIATQVIERVKAPKDLLGNYLLLERMRSNSFRQGMTLALAGKKLRAQMAFQSVIRSEDDRSWAVVDRRNAEVAIDLLDDTKRFHDFADLLILRTRNAIHPIGDTLPATYPWIKSERVQ